MTFKFGVYIVVTIAVIWTLGSININAIFKKNANPLQAKLLVFMMSLSMIYLVTNFIIDIMESIKIL